MNPLIVPLKICPVAPTGVAAYTDQISGMVLWSVLWLFGIAAFILWEAWQRWYCFRKFLPCR